MRSSCRHRIARAAGAIVATTVLTAFGATAAASPSQARPAARGHGHHLTDVHVGVLPIVDNSPVYVGMKEGFFKQEGLKVTPVMAESGSDIIPAVLSGSEQFGFSNNVSLIVASSKGLPVTIVSGALTPGSSTKGGYVELLVKASSPIKHMKQLAGKTIAVNALGNVGPLTINYALQKAGVKPSSVHFVQIPFPSMNTALEKGHAAVIWEVEPFLAVLKLQHVAVRVLSNTMATVSPHFPVSSYFSTTTYLAHHHRIAVEFQKAIRRSINFAQHHRKVVAAVLPSYTKITGKLEHFLTYPVFTTNPEVGVLHKTAKLAERYKYTNGAPKWSTLLAGLHVAHPKHG